MTDFDGNTMIERYMAGRMGASEKQAFLKRLEQDDELRRALYAETLINRAIRSDRSAVPSQPAASRARFMAMLAVVAPETAVTTPQNGGGASGAGKLAQAGKFIGGSGAAKGIIAVVAGITATIGTLVVVPKLSRTNIPAPVPVSAIAPQKQSPPVEAVETSPAVIESQRTEISLPETAPGVVTGTSAIRDERKTSLQARQSAAIERPARGKQRADVSETASGGKPAQNEVPMVTDETNTKLPTRAPQINR